MDNRGLSATEAKQLALRRIVPNGRLVSGREYEHFFAFFTAPKGSDISSGLFVGDIDSLLCVDKKTREVFYAGDREDFVIPSFTPWKKVRIDA